MKPGEIVLVRFPFTDLDSTKQRPALVLSVVKYSSKLELVIAAMVTSKVDQPKIDGDEMIAEWKEAGLLHPSMVRLSKIATLESGLISKSLGSLNKADRISVKKWMARLFGEWL